MYLKEYNDARDALTTALNIHKNDQSFIILGKIHLLQGDVPGAIEVYKRAVSWVLIASYYNTWQPYSQ